MWLKDTNLIFDIGMHRGEDTDYYLSKGFKVIAFEANPELVALSRIKFAEQVQSGRLIIVEGAIVPVSEGKRPSHITFYKNNVASEWGTISPDWVQRNETYGTHSIPIEVPTVDLAAIIRKHGMPFYLKADIEGMDIECINIIAQFDVKPDYISIEAEKENFDTLKKDLNLLETAGFTRFKIIQQENTHEQKEPIERKTGRFLNYTFPPGSSGLFGPDLPGKWHGRVWTLILFRFIFILYWLFGDYGLNKKHYKIEVLRKRVNKYYKRPLPGWHDIHARHKSINKMT